MFRLSTSLLLTAILLGAGIAQAVPVPGLFDTGVDNGGALLAAGATDPHYALIVSADPVYPGPSAVVADPIASPYWIANSATSQWIAPAMPQGYPSGGTPHPAGTYTYRLSFDLTGIDPNTAVVSGACGMDNNGRIALNGVLIATAIGGYAPLVDFSITSGFVAGLNHLDFVVNNLAAEGSNPTGVRVQGLTGTGIALPTAVPPARDGAAGPRLLPNLPNPFNPRTTIRFELPAAGQVRLAVYDLAGRLVRTLVDGTLAAASHEAVWDGQDSTGRSAASGSYFARLETSSGVRTIKLTLAK